MKDSISYPNCTFFTKSASHAVPTPTRVFKLCPRASEKREFPSVKSDIDIKCCGGIIGDMHGRCNKKGNSYPYFLKLEKQPDEVQTI